MSTDIVYNFRNVGEMSTTDLPKFRKQCMVLPNIRELCESQWPTFQKQMPNNRTCCNISVDESAAERDTTGRGKSQSSQGCRKS